MTLCIAAECDYKGTPAIVLCCDWRAQTTESASGFEVGRDDARKLREIGSWSILISGNPDHAKDLIAKCKQPIKEFSEKEIDPDNPEVAISEFQTQLRLAAESRKREIVHHYVAMSYGKNYDEFLKSTRPENVTDFHNDIWSGIRRLNLGTDLLICGFCRDTPVIINLDALGHAAWVDNYGIIGDGWQHARTMLCLQPWNSFGDPHVLGPWGPVPLEHCIYRVVEAKEAAHIANPQKVGEAITIQILIKGKGRFGVNWRFLEEMQGLFLEKHKVPQTLREGEGKFKKSEIMVDWKLRYER